MRILLSLAMSCVLVSACASREPAEPATVATTEPGARTSLVPAVNVVPESGLGAQNLERGECALFIWSKTDASRFIFFQKAETGVATLKIGSETVTATQTMNRGSIFGQFMTEQGFAAPGGEQVVLRVQPGDDLDGGQRIQSGNLTITAAEGWRTVIPVLGVRACQP